MYIFEQKTTINNIKKYEKNKVKNKLIESSLIEIENEIIKENEISLNKTNELRNQIKNINTIKQQQIKSQNLQAIKVYSIQYTYYIHYITNEYYLDISYLMIFDFIVYYIYGIYLI